MYKRGEANNGLVLRNHMLYSGVPANLALQRKKGGREQAQMELGRYTGSADLSEQHATPLNFARDPHPSFP